MKCDRGRTAVLLIRCLHRVSNDTGAEIYANEGSPTFLEEINPGNEVKGGGASSPADVGE